MKIRRQYIRDCVEKYKTDYKDQYNLFLEQVQERREKMADKKFGKLQGDNELRLAISLPEKLMAMFDFALDGVHEKRFGDDKGEMEWFTKKYPEFLIPNQY